MSSIGIFFVPFVLVGILFVLAALLMWLWNITFPDLFQLPTITFWQAFRILIIAGLLFGGSSIIKIGY